MLLLLDSGEPDKPCERVNACMRNDAMMDGWDDHMDHIEYEKRFDRLVNHPTDPSSMTAP